MLKPNLKTQSTQITSNKVANSPTLSRYVKKNALFSILFAVLGLWLLQLLFSYLAQLEDLNDSYTYVDALKYIVYRSPYFLEEFIPTGALLGAVVGLGLLANNSEIIVMRAAGVSIYRIVVWVLQPALLFVLIALGVNQFVLPQTNPLASQIRDPDKPLLSAVDGYWTLRSLDDVSNDVSNEISGYNSSSSSSSSSSSEVSANKDGFTSEIIFIDYADASGNIGEVKRWQIEENYRLLSASKAQGGHYVESAVNQAVEPAVKPTVGQTTADGLNGLVDSSELSDVSDVGNLVADKSTYQWQLNNLSEVRITQDIDQAMRNQTPLVDRVTANSAIMHLPISPSSIYLLTRRAEDLSLTELYEHYRFNDAQGLRSIEHEVAFWQKLLSPFAILSLVVIACSFVFGSLRTHSLGLRIVVSLLFGLLFSYMQDLTGFVSLATGISPLLMVSLPIIISALLGVILLRRQM